MHTPTTRILGLAALVLALSATPVAAKPKGPALTTPVTTLQQALTCNGDLAHAQHDPVLLVHGTFADSEINWSWNYKLTLPALGIPACTVDLPGVSAGDIQVSTEYVVYAVRAMAAASHRNVAIIGHSQGGLEARWALEWWPDLRHLVSDVVMLGTPNQGSAFPDAVCTAPFFCAASLYQMQTGSAFLNALNEGRDTTGSVDYTAIGTTDDQIFVLEPQTQLATTSPHITNIAVQDVCPGHPVDHVGLAYDGAAFAIVIDALQHNGPAKAARVDRSFCDEVTMPGVTIEEAIEKVTAYGTTLVQLLGPDGPKAAGEPPLACYVTRSCD